MACRLPNRRRADSPPRSSSPPRHYHLLYTQLRDCSSATPQFPPSSEQPCHVRRDQGGLWQGRSAFRLKDQTVPQLDNHKAGPLSLPEQRCASSDMCGWSPDRSDHPFRPSLIDTTKKARWIHFVRIDTKICPSAKSRQRTTGLLGFPCHWAHAIEWLKRSGRHGRVTVDSD